MTFKTLAKVALRHHRDDRVRAVHRRRRLDLRLAADRQPGGADVCPTWILGFTDNKWVFLLLANLLMLFVGCFLEPTAAITILVPDPAADRRAARHRSGALRPDHGAEPDDRPAAPADGHGAVRALARRQAVGRAHDDGDPALAGAAASSRSVVITFIPAITLWLPTQMGLIR